MRILIVGGAGFVGSNLVRRCLQEPRNRVTVVDSLDPRFRSEIGHFSDILPSIEFVHADTRDEVRMGEVVARQDVIFNCAAQTSHPLSLRDPLFDAEINCLGTLKLLEAVRRHNRNAVVVYPSSSTVIGKAPGDVIDESHSERPSDIYSANKAVAEKYHLIYNIVHDIKTVVLRFANLYGPWGKPYPEFGFLNYFIHLAWSGSDITVYGAGAQTRNVMYVDDAAEVLYKSAFNPVLHGKVLFAAHDEHLGVLDIARKIVKVFERGRVVNVEWPDMRRRIEIDNVTISSARLRDLTGWAPRYSFEEGLAETRSVMERRSCHDQPADYRGAGPHWVQAHPGALA